MTLLTDLLPVALADASSLFSPVTIFFAQAAEAIPLDPYQPKALPAWVWVLYGGAFIGIIYFMIIRPQQVQRQQQEELVQKTRIGDKCTLSGGILGSIANVKKNTFMVKIADGVKIEVLKSAVLEIKRTKGGDDDQPETQAHQEADDASDSEEEGNSEEAASNSGSTSSAPPKKSRRRR